MANTSKIFETYYDNFDITGDTGKKDMDLEKYSLTIEELEKEVTDKMEKEFRNKFDRQSMYVGNGIYTVAGLYSSDTRQLFLMYCVLMEDLKMSDFADKMETIRARRSQATTTSDEWDDGYANARAMSKIRGKMSR